MLQEAMAMISLRFTCIDVESYEQVAEYKGKLNTDVYAHLVHNTAVQYNNAYMSG